MRTSPPPAAHGVNSRPRPWWVPVLAGALLTACGALRVPIPLAPVSATPVYTAEVALPSDGALPALFGRLQAHELRERETLLDVARAADVGLRELQAANPGIDDWVPPVGHRLTVPTVWIPPRSKGRGIVINIPEMRMYVFPESARAGETVTVRTWPIGIGTDEAPSPVGGFTVRSKDENPVWVVPQSILRKEKDQKPIVPPGPDNPLGKYRIRLSRGLYAIHGTNSPWSIGRKTTHGCIRLYPEDIETLYPMVKPGMHGELLYQTVKLGEERGRVYVEVHDDVYERVRDLERHAFDLVRRAGLKTRVDPAKLRAAIEARSGIPTDITRDAAPTLEADSAAIRRR